MIYFFILMLFLISSLIVWYTITAWIDLDRWIADAPNREKNGYVEPVKIITLSQPKPKTVITLTPKLENFPKTTEDTKAKIDRLLKSQK